MSRLLTSDGLNMLICNLPWAMGISINMFALQGYPDTFTSYKKYKGRVVSVSGSYDHIFASIGITETSFTVGVGLSSSPVSVGVSISEMKFRKKWTKKFRKWGIKIRKGLKDLVDEYVGYHVHYHNRECIY